MAELTSIQGTEAVRLVGADSAGVETYPLAVKSNQEAAMSDTCSTSAIDAVLNLTPSAIEGRVGASRLVNRKSVVMQALTPNVKWGYNTDCNFFLFKNQIIIDTLGDQPIYFKVTIGTGQVTFAEKS